MSNRLKYIDIAKGGAIIIVVSGHLVQFNLAGHSAEAVFNFIGSFQMPLFFFLSGFVAALSRDKITGSGVLYYLKKRALTLLVPFVVWGLVIPMIFSSNIFNPHDWLIKLYDILKQPDKGPWFVLTLFFIQLWFLIISLVGNRGERNPLLLETAVAILIIAGCYAGERITQNSYYFNYQYAICFLSGYFINRYFSDYIAPKNSLDRNTWTSLVICVSFLVFWFFSTRFEFGNSPGLMRMTAGLAISLCVVYVAQRIDVSKYHTTRLLSLIGRHTLEIYVTHYFVVVFLFHHINVSQVRPIPLFVVTIIISTFISVLVVFFAKIISYMPFMDTILYGKFKKKTISNK